MKWGASVLVVALFLTGARPIFPSASSCCPMGGDMSCCLLDGSPGDAGCALRACGGRENAAIAVATASRAILAPMVTLPEPLAGLPLSIPVESLALLRSDRPSTPPPRA